MGNTNWNIWIPSAATAYFPSIKVQAWYRAATGFYASLPVTMMTLAAAPTETMLEIANHTNQYTTTESVIGRDISGKPIYRRTATGTFPAIAQNGNNSNISTGLTGIYSLVDFGGWWYDGYKNCATIGYCDSRTNHYCVVYKTGDPTAAGEVKLNISNAGAAMPAGNPWAVWAIYTKS